MEIKYEYYNRFAKDAVKRLLRVKKYHELVDDMNLINTLYKLELIKDEVKKVHSVLGFTYSIAEFSDYPDDVNYSDLSDDERNKLGKIEINSEILIAKDDERLLSLIDSFLTNDVLSPDVTSMDEPITFRNAFSTSMYCEVIDTYQKQ